MPPRGARLPPSDFINHGYTVGCRECTRLETGIGHRKAHSEECRKRIEEILKESEEGRVRVEREGERVAQWMEEQYHQQKEEAQGCKKGRRPGEAEAPVGARKEEEKKEDPDTRLIAALMKGVDITEVYSPQRVVKYCSKYGLVPGDSFDIKTGWDLTKAGERKRCT